MDRGLGPGVSSLAIRATVSAAVSARDLARGLWLLRLPGLPTGVRRIQMTIVGPVWPRVDSL